MTLPSTGSTSPLTSNQPDVLAVRQVSEEPTDSGREIIVVAHSYGSTLTCESIKSLGREERGKLGKAGGVVRLVFIAGVVAAGRREPSGYHWGVRDGSPLGTVRGELTTLFI